jgi:multiple sugar transport system permease protein
MDIPLTESAQTRAKPATREQQRFNLWRTALFLLAIVGMLLMVWPVVWTVLTSLKLPSEILRTPLTLAPDNWLYTGNFTELFSRYPVWRWLLNSLIVTSLSLVSTLSLCSLAGYAFAKLHFRGKEVLFVSVIALLMMPPEVTLIPLYLMFSDVGLINTYAGIVGPNWLSVIGVFVMRQFMEAIPTDYIDAARIDGAGEFRIFYTVALPLTLPGFATLAVLKTLLTWNDFLWPLVAATQPDMMTLTVGLQSLNTSLYVEYTLLSAGVVVSMIPLFLMFVFLQRWVMQSVVYSGLKG